MNLGDLVQFYGASNTQPSKQPRNQFKAKPQYQTAPQSYNHPYPPFSYPQTIPPVLNYAPQIPAPIPQAHAPNFVPPPPPVQYVPPVYNKRPKPPKPAEDDEEGEFSCDACEKYFKTLQQHEAHLKSHVKCTYPGCTFNAAYSVVKLHKMRHLNSAIGKEETPEEVNRYIEERKKRFPTTHVVAKKAEEEQRRRERGEIMDKNSRFNRKNNRNNNNNKRNNRNEFPKRHEAQELPVPPEVTNENEASGSGVNESDQPEELKIVKSDHIPVTTDDIQPRTQEHGVKRKRSCKYFMQGRCLKGDQCTFAHEEMNPRKKPRQSHDQNKKSSLLEKLLHTEIQKEHSAILQCFRHIIANNFFVQSTNSSAE